MVGGGGCLKDLSPQVFHIRERAEIVGRGRAGLDGKGWHGAGIRHSVAGSGEQATSSHATAPDGG